MSPRGSARRRRDAHAVFYGRSAVCSLCDITENQLMLWEHEELIAPARMIHSPSGSEHLYDNSALKRLRLIRTLAVELEVNIPGISVILHLLDASKR
jgi:DNA-binding transcriptional MerR regulator